MATDRFGQKIPDGNGRMTYEFAVIQFLRSLKGTSLVTEEGETVNAGLGDLNVKVGQSNVTLNQILAALQSGKDFELAIVKWTYTEEGVEHTEILKQVTLREGSEFTVKYYNAAGEDVTEQVKSKGTVELLDSTELLNEILTKLDSLIGKTNKSVTSFSTDTPGTIPAGTISGSVCNAGLTDGVFNGHVIKAGMTISWGDPHVVSFTAMSYDATGTEFIINYVA